MDIGIVSNDGNFKFRVSGIVQQDGKTLVMQINNNEFYCMPGGHVEIGELAEEAIEREMKEELTFPVKIKKLICIHENIFFRKDGKPFNEIAFYYLSEPTENVDKSDKTFVENDKGELKTLFTSWKTDEELKKLHFKPEMVRKIILEKDTDFKLITSRDKK